MMQAVVLRIPLDSDLKARKLLSFCRRHNLEAAALGIHRIIAHDRYRAGRMAEAVVHYAEAKEYRKVAAIADQLLESYIETNDMQWSIVARAVPQEALFENDRLSFLYRYDEFHALYKDGKSKEAASLLSLLFASESAPRRFWTTLLVDAIPLLEAEEALFSKDETLELMRCLEEVESSHRREEYLLHCKEDTFESVEKKMDVVRFALVRNLAKAFST
ncbi:Nup85 nucleoporin-domain-containing protein [Blyttiomyces helicus]|uniref:Nuclear pore complex protein Nup85 n=1 Tax=Blyttiomyces helicus TaxID=388810 RepID=A0A4P9VVQ8_9FUNG|nr:Nup85 nucleoporin-domain-containing protein [Blyttiomyces helicus]|eukprot:RKO83751.1 Nup85 nucleoporin-domain-containing protein [Blyttiomyces helicus]